MKKVSVLAASLVLVALVSSTAMADPLLSVGGLELGNSNAVGNPLGLPTVTDLVGNPAGGSVGVPGVAEVTSSGSNPLSDTSVALLGGGGQSLDAGVGGVLGQTGINLGVSLPDTAGLPGLPTELPVLPGILDGNGNGNNGNNGTNGTNGTNGHTTVNVFLAGNGNGANGGAGGNGGNFRFGSGSSGNITFSANNASSRLRMLLKILEDRDWLRLAAGNMVCLNGFGTASVPGWLSQAEMGQLKQVVQAYKRDIVTLQKMLSNCRPNAQQISKNDMKRVIGIDIKDGKPVLFML